MVFHSTVLALRGDVVTPQPMISDNDEFVLGWNGEAWAIDGKTITANDTETVFRGLAHSRRFRSKPDDPTYDHIKFYIASISGPFAFVFYDRTENRLYFGRDATGRRSLMVRENADSLIICSCSNPEEQEGWKELQPDGVYTLDLNSLRESGIPGKFMKHTRLQTWDSIAESAPSTDKKLHVQTVPRVNRALTTTAENLKFDSKSVEALKTQLTEALRLRLRAIPSWGPATPTTATSASKSFDERTKEKVAVLFSGGLDCTVLARLSHDLVPLNQPIALLNVAFENPRLTKIGEAEHSQCEACPDRITAREALEELQATCPGRRWVFIAVDITYEELVLHRDTIVTLMRPHDTEMDLSIAMALYFASRGVGYISSNAEARPYQTTARVLLSGLGADELFGGYIRHENAWKRGGLEALISELQLDIGRIGTRNLGRDDRVTACWAREVRYPFLDESLVNWVAGLPVWQKCRIGMEWEGDDVVAAKYLLRRLALELGLEKTSREKKRAIQFGTRSAKMFSRKAKGTEAINSG